MEKKIYEIRERILTALKRCLDNIDLSPKVRELVVANFLVNRQWMIDYQEAVNLTLDLIENDKYRIAFLVKRSSNKLSYYIFWRPIYLAFLEFHQNYGVLFDPRTNPDYAYDIKSIYDYVEDFNKQDLLWGENGDDINSSITNNICICKYIGILDDHIDVLKKIIDNTSEVMLSLLKEGNKKIINTHIFDDFSIDKFDIVFREEIKDRIQRNGHLIEKEIAEDLYSITKSIIRKPKKEDWEKLHDKYYAEVISNCTKDKTLKLIRIDSDELSPISMIYDIIKEEENPNILLLSKDKKIHHLFYSISNLLEYFNLYIHICFKLDYCKKQINPALSYDDILNCNKLQVRDVELDCKLSEQTSISQESVPRNIPQECHQAVRNVLNAHFNVKGKLLNSANQMKKAAGKISLEKPTVVGLFLVVCQEVGAVKSDANQTEFVRALIGLGLKAYKDEDDITKTAKGFYAKVNGEGKKEGLPKEHDKWKKKNDRKIGTIIYDELTK